MRHTGRGQAPARAGKRLCLRTGIGALRSVRCPFAPASRLVNRGALALSSPRYTSRMAARPEVHRVQLTCHPATPAGDAVHGIEVLISRDAEGALHLGYMLHADTARVAVPTQKEPERVDGLWKHTCFEAFVSSANDPAYCELNFAPSSEWAAYRFTSYREGVVPLDIETLRLVGVRPTKHGLGLNAVVQWNGAPELRNGARNRVALTAVIEESDGRLSYWALRHPPGKPDFHHPDGFALEL
jgi:hypothetical protein